MFSLAGDDGKLGLLWKKESERDDWMLDYYLWIQVCISRDEEEIFFF